MERTLLRITISALLLSTATLEAQEQTWACQYTDSIGFSFEDGQYNPTRFKVPEPFFLKTEEESLVPSSAVGALEALGHTGEAYCHPRKIHPVTDGSMQTCSDPYGNTIIFSTTAARGAVSKMLGSVQVEDTRIPTGVLLFVCQSM
ncbi:hypothetical protein [Meridianimarinicoccus aquatilis]|uniref:Uncharacterized protein n=1 Tax=Meridianimarinicoccus aquatilis TaxID=2552766 RepID=A0A4R6AYS9_9RHOB|nr:hypothetical protein [Fluviibacterium aquatile]TDL88028.1 hypothetical protein E2L05_09785 [Fluviibacterium aquatile]